MLRRHNSGLSPPSPHGVHATNLFLQRGLALLKRFNIAGERGLAGSNGEMLMFLAGMLLLLQLPQLDALHPRGLQRCNCCLQLQAELWRGRLLGAVLRRPMPVGRAVLLRGALLAQQQVLGQQPLVSLALQQRVCFEQGGLAALDCPFECENDVVLLQTQRLVPFRSANLVLQILHCPAGLCVLVLKLQCLALRLAVQDQLVLGWGQGKHHSFSE